MGAGPGHRHGYDLVSLEGSNEAKPEGANLLENTSTGVAAQRRRMETGWDG